MIWQLILTGVFYAWLFLILWLLWAIWHDSRQRLTRLEQTLVEAIRGTSQAAQRAAEAAHLLAEKHKGQP